MSDWKGEILEKRRQPLETIWFSESCSEILGLNMKEEDDNKVSSGLLVAINN
jgi:hypothetical protein